MVINLLEFRPENSRVYSGRHEGEEVRKKVNLDKHDTSIEKIIINVPEDTLAVNTSFFLGMFGKSVRLLGKSGFERKYNFECPEVINVTIIDGINRALKRSKPL